MTLTEPFKEIDAEMCCWNCKHYVRVARRCKHRKVDTGEFDYCGNFERREGEDGLLTKNQIIQMARDMPQGDIIEPDEIIEYLAEWVQKLKSMKKEERFAFIPKILKLVVDKSPVIQNQVLKQIKEITNISLTVLGAELKAIERDINHKEEKQAKDIPKPIQRSSLVLENELWEQVYDGQISKFAVWNGKKVEYKDNYNAGDSVITPIHDQTLTEGAVILPSEAQDYSGIKNLLEEIRLFIHKYSDISEEIEHISSWYVLLTWVYDRLRTVPYMRVRGDTGTGKTRYLDTVGSICYHATKAAGCITPAPIYRLIRLWRGTVILDEADFKKSDEASEVVKILNCGFQKNMPVIRCNVNDPDKLEILPTFGPKIIATRQSFKDKALESRCLTEIMRKTHRKDIPIDLTYEFFREAQALRNKLLMFRFKNFHMIDADAGLNIEMGEGIEPRIKQAMVSFPAIFINDKEALDDFKRFIRKHQEEVIEERAESFDGAIVNALAEIILERLPEASKVPSNGEAQVTIEGENKEVPLETNPLLELNITPKEISERITITDKPINPAVIGKHLKSLHISNHVKKVNGKAIRALDLSDMANLESIFASYIPYKELLERVTARLQVYSSYSCYRGLAPFFCVNKEIHTSVHKSIVNEDKGINTLSKGDKRNMPLTNNKKKLLTKSNNKKVPNKSGNKNKPKKTLSVTGRSAPIYGVTSVTEEGPVTLENNLENVEIEEIIEEKPQKSQVHKTVDELVTAIKSQSKSGEISVMEAIKMGFTDELIDRGCTEGVWFRIPGGKIKLL